MKVARKSQKSAEEIGDICGLTSIIDVLRVTLDPAALDKQVGLF
jgi:hypothetical protein